MYIAWRGSLRRPAATQRAATSATGAQYTARRGRDPLASSTALWKQYHTHRGALPTQLLFPSDPQARASLRKQQQRNFSGVAAAAISHDSSKPIKWTPEGAKLVNGRLKFLPRAYEVRELAIEAGLNPEEWAIASSSFRQSFMKEPEFYFHDLDELNHFIQDFNHGAKKGNAFVFYPHFLQFANEKNYIPKRDDSAFTLQQITDLRLPHELYPRANAMQRKIIYHDGPTNSGKTFQALERLKQAGEDGGLYCGPLRLLALEVYERLNMDGIYTSLVTGQEKKILPHATHVSCTVEMANINKKWDVAVIDEIQLIGDPQRGWAWTRALFGLQANEIHVCGSGEAKELVEKFAQATGDEFELQSYERRSPLAIEETHLNSYRKIKSGDCVVAFSRREIFQIKRDIEVKSGQKCCIIYGQLPPETRSQQARLFNAQDNDFNVLVASDAVGMGLNLNIGRVVFSSVKKYTGGGGGMTDISPSLAKQIAGRAGRFGGAFAQGGTATTLASEDLKYLHDSYHAPVVSLKSAGIFPSSEQMEEFAKQLPGITDLGDLLDKYVTLARLDGDYFMCNHIDMKEAAALLCDFPMQLSDRFTFCQAPANLRNMLARRVFTEYAKAHANDESVKLDIYLPKYAPQTAESLRDIEIKAQIIDLYLWLSLRFDKTFVEHELAMEMKQRALQLVEEGLVNTTYQKSHKKGQLHRPSNQRERGGGGGRRQGDNGEDRGPTRGGGRFAASDDGDASQYDVQEDDFSDVIGGEDDDEGGEGEDSGDEEEEDGEPTRRYGRQRGGREGGEGGGGRGRGRGDQWAERGADFNKRVHDRIIRGIQHKGRR